MRGEGLPSSDLDVVVLFDSVARAWRESFHFEGWPIEIFAHDSETLVYFMREVRVTGARLSRRWSVRR